MIFNFILFAGICLLMSSSQVAALLLGENVLQNGGGEENADGQCAFTGDVVGWTKTAGNMTVGTYVGCHHHLPSSTSPGPSDRGLTYFWGGNGNAISSMYQNVTLMSRVDAINAGHINYNISAYMGGLDSDPDNCAVTITFKGSAASSTLGQGTIGPVTPQQRGNILSMLYRSAAGVVPAGSVLAVVELKCTKLAGTVNNGYADNIELIFSEKPPPPPKGHYTFNGNADDVSGGGNHGVVHGAMLTTDRWGNPDGCYSFNGASFIEVVDGTDFDFTGSFTVSMWMKRAEIQVGAAVILSKTHVFNEVRKAFVVERASATGDSYKLTTRIAGAWAFSGSVTIAAEDWGHLVAVKGTGTYDLYFNGVLVSSSTCPTSPIESNGAAPLQIGALRKSSSLVSNFYAGLLDDIRLYDRALTAQEVAQLHAEESTAPSPAPTVAPTKEPTVAPTLNLPIRCLSTRFCASVENNVVYCYGSTGACKWNSNDCLQDSDCNKYTPGVSSRYTAHACSLTSTEWTAETCSLFPSSPPLTSPPTSQPTQPTSQPSSYPSADSTATLCDPGQTSCYWVQQGALLAGLSEKDAAKFTTASQITALQLGVAPRLALKFKHPQLKALKTGVDAPTALLFESWPQVEALQLGVAVETAMLFTQWLHVEALKQPGVTPDEALQFRNWGQVSALQEGATVAQALLVGV